MTHSTTISSCVKQVQDATTVTWNHLPEVLTARSDLRGKMFCSGVFIDLPLQISPGAWLLMKPLKTSSKAQDHCEYTKSPLRLEKRGLLLRVWDWKGYLWCLSATPTVEGTLSYKGLQSEKEEDWPKQFHLGSRERIWPFPSLLQPLVPGSRQSLGARWALVVFWPWLDKALRKSWAYHAPPLNQFRFFCLLFCLETSSLWWSETFSHPHEVDHNHFYNILFLYQYHSSAQIVPSLLQCSQKCSCSPWLYQVFIHFVMPYKSSLLVSSPKDKELLNMLRMRAFDI